MRAFRERLRDIRSSGSVAGGDARAVTELVRARQLLTGTRRSAYARSLLNIDRKPLPTRSSIESPGIAELSLERFRRWLDQEHTRSGTRLRDLVPLDEGIGQALRGYSDGAWGFVVDPDRIRIRETALPGLREALERGPINGVGLLALPERLPTSMPAEAAWLYPDETIPDARLIEELVGWEYLLAHFLARGGEVNRASDIVTSPPEVFADPDSGEEILGLSLRFRREFEGHFPGTDASAFFSNASSFEVFLEWAFCQIDPSVGVAYQHADAPRLFFHQWRPIAPGAGSSFGDAVRSAVSLPTLSQLFAILTSAREPCDAKTYPVPGQGEWVAAIDPRHALIASSGEGRLTVRRVATFDRGSVRRFRHVIG